jgi:hypothetical protein
MPSLPVELWIKILREATRVPQIFNLIPNTQVIDGIELSTKEKQTLLTSSFVTKLSIVRVCWQWNVIGTEFLHESIVISRGDQFRELLECFCLQHARGVSSGRHTRRLDLLCRTTISNDADDYARQAMAYMTSISIFVESSRPGSG